MNPIPCSFYENLENNFIKKLLSNRSSFLNLDTMSTLCIFCKERKGDNVDVAIGMNYGVASFFSWFKSICNPKTNIMRIRGPPMTTTSFQR